MSLREKIDNDNMYECTREREKKRFRLSRRDCPSMAVSPDELICLLLLSLMLSTEQEEKTIQLSSKVIFLWLSHWEIFLFKVQ